MSELSPWEGFTRDPRGSDTSGLRASDADRDHAARLLADAYADGRLRPDEYEQRLDAAMNATHLGDFKPLLSDLAPIATQRVVAPIAPPRVPWHKTPAFYAISAAAGVLIGIAVLALVLGGNGGWWWMIWPFAFFILPQIVDLLKTGINRTAGHGGTNQLPRPNDSPDRDDD